jgi:hypothetical protein
MKACQTDAVCSRNVEMRNFHKPHISKYEGKRLIGRLGVYMKNDIKMDPVDVGCACMLWNKLASCPLCDCHLLKNYNQGLKRITKKKQTNKQTRT